MVTESQLKFIADVLVTTGELCLASLVIPYLTSASGLSVSQFIVGIIGAATSWIMGLIVIKNTK